MLMHNPKKVATLIIGKMSPKIEGPKGPGDMEEKPESDYEAGFEACAEQMLEAISSKNVKKFVQTMKNFHEMFDDQAETEEDQEEQSEEMESGKEG